MEASTRVQNKFYESFPACQQERDYKFITPSTMKPTQVKCAPGGLNQIPGRGLHSSTFQLNLSAFNGIGGARRDCAAQVKGLSGGV